MRRLVITMAILACVASSCDSGAVPSEELNGRIDLEPGQSTTITYRVDIESQVPFAYEFRLQVLPLDTPELGSVRYLGVEDVYVNDSGAVSLMIEEGSWSGDFEATWISGSDAVSSGYRVSVILGNGDPAAITAGEASITITELDRTDPRSE